MPGLLRNATLCASKLVLGKKPMLTYSLGYFTSVTEVNAVARADIDTGWLKTPVNPFNTQVTLLGHPFLFFKLHHAERAGVDAIFAADAELLVKQDNTVRSFGYCVHRADIPTRSLATMHAVSNSISKSPLIFHDTRSIWVDSYPSWADGQVMFLLAGDLTSTATHTLCGVNDKGKFFCH